MDTEPVESAGGLTYNVNVWKVQSVLRIASDFCVHLHSPVPSRWVRLWYWALLGWTWEKPKE